MKVVSGPSQTRRMFAVAAVLSAALFASSACLFTAQSGQSTSEDDSGVSMDSGVDGSSGCSSAADCDPPEGATATCTSQGECQYSCGSAYLNPDDDASDGCECKTSEATTAWADCDADNYAGNVGSSATPEGSDRMALFCKDDGANRPTDPLSFCNDPEDAQWVVRNPNKMGNGDCEDEDPEVYEGRGENTNFDELWLCDGKNNDCDRTSNSANIDEQCCGGQSSGWEYGDGTFELSEGDFLRVTRPTSNAPPEAVAVAVWAHGNDLNEPDELSIAYLAANGELLDEPTTIKFPESDGDVISRSSVTQIAVDTAGTGYHLMVALQAGGLNELTNITPDNRTGIYSVFADASLSDIGRLDPVHYRGNEVNGLQLHARGNQTPTVTAVAGIRIGSGADFQLRACQFKGGSAEKCRFQKDFPADPLSTGAYPSMAAGPNAFYVGWWDKNSSEIPLFKLPRSFDSSGNFILEDDKIDITPDGNAAEPIDLSLHEKPGTRTKVLDVVYPNFTGQDDHANLMFSRRNVGDLTATSNPTRLAAASEDVSHSEPSMEVFSEQESMTVSWRTVRFGGTGLNTATYSLSDPMPKGGNVILQDGLGNHEDGGITTTRVARGTLVGWGISGGSMNYGHYLSTGGKPICQR